MQVSSQSTTVGAGLDDPFGAVSTVFVGCGVVACYGLTSKFN